MYRTRVGVDLAKKVIQVCIVKNKRVLSNVEMTPDEFRCWLANTKPVTVIFEACSTSNYWKQQALAAGHDARLVSAKLVAAVRQNQKTDKNDALAIVQAACLPDVSFIAGKDAKQQQLQSMQRLRELGIKQRDASQKQLVSLLLELNFRVPNNSVRLLVKMGDILEDAENGLSTEFRQALHAATQQLEGAIHTVAVYDKCLEQSINIHPDCKKLLKLEGVGPVNAVNLYISLGCAEMGTFAKGKDASAAIGLTPIQHSSGGKVKLGTIGKACRNSMLRSQLISGAMSVVRQLVKRPAKTEKERWLKALIERRGNKCAAVALANKTVRTAYAMLTQGTEYKADLLAA